MFESLVADIIAKYIGEYIKNLSSEQLKINIFSGNVVLKNLEIKGEALQSFKLPLHVQKGIIGTLTLKIPWTNIKSNPVILEIDSISLYAIPQTGFDYNEEEEKKKQLELKRKKLEKFELIRSFKEGSGGDHKTTKQDTFMASVMSKVLNNIQVKIQNFHLRYEEIKGGKVYSLGLSFSSLTAFPTDSNWNVSGHTSNNSNSNSSTPTTAGSLFKYIELTNFSIYLNSENKKESISNILGNGNDNQVFIDSMKSMIGTQESMGNHQYILKPIIVKLKIELNRNLDMNLEIPKMKCYCQFDQVSFILEENQYQSILKLLTTIGNYAQEIKYLKYRPKLRPKQDAKAWWKYVGDVVRESIREKIQQRSWNFIQKRRQNRKEYILLFKKLQNVDWLDPINEKELKLLSEMEEVHLSFEDIIYFRSLARRELAMETVIADSKKGEFYASLNRNSTSTTNTTKQGFFGSWSNWATGSSPSSTSPSSTTLPKMSIQLTKEQQAEIEKSMEYDEIALSATIEMPAHYVSNVFEVQIDAVIFTIIGSRGPSENPLIKSYLNNINFKLNQREQGFKLELDLESFNVSDNNKNTLFPYVVTSNPKYKRQISTLPPKNQDSDNNNLFHIIFESKPINSSYDYALSLMLKSLEIIINKQQIERLVEFATPKENVNLFSLSSAALEEFILLKEMTIFQLREVINHHKTIDLFIDAKAPILIIPEHMYINEQQQQQQQQQQQEQENKTNIIILDLGNFTMQSDISKKPRKSNNYLIETPFKLNEQITKLIDQVNQDEINTTVDDVEEKQHVTSVVKQNDEEKEDDEDDDDLNISDLYDHYRASLSSIKVLLATHDQDWYLPDELNLKGYQLIEEMSINLHIQSCIEPNELSLSMFKVSGILPQVKVNLSDNLYLRLYQIAKTLGKIHSKTTTTTYNAYNHIMDIYSNTQDTFIQQVDAKTTEIKLSDEYKQVLSKRKIFDAKFKLEKVLVNIISLNSSGTSSSNSSSSSGIKLLQLRISDLQVSLKKKTYDYNGNLLLGSLEVEDCQETSERFNCLITSQSRTSSSLSSSPNNTLISIHTEMIDRESPNYKQVDTLVDFSFGELNFNYNPKSMGKIICFLDYCFEETFKIQEKFIDQSGSTLGNLFHLQSSSSSSSSTTLQINSSESSPYLESSTTSSPSNSNFISSNPLSKSNGINSKAAPAVVNSNSNSMIIKAKASIYSLSISLNEEGRELGRFSINQFAIEECKISGRSLEIQGYLESISIDSFLDHPTEGFKILTPIESGVSMANFKYSTFDNSSNASIINNNNNTKNKSSSTSSLPNSGLESQHHEFDKEIQLYLRSIRLTVLVDFILKTKHLIELPFKTVKYDSIYKYQQQQEQQEDGGSTNTSGDHSFDLQQIPSSSTSSDNTSIKVIDILGNDQQPIGFKPLKINYKIFLESPQIILSNSDDIHSDHDRIIAELGSIDIKTTIIKDYQSINNTEIQWESIEANLCDMNIRTFKNGIYHQVLHNLSIFNKIDTVLCDGNGKYISFEKLPNQKRININIKEIKIEFLDLEHSLILSLTKDVIKRITSTSSTSSSSLSSSTKLLPTVSSPSTNTPTLFVNSDKEYLITSINVGIDKFQLILKLDQEIENNFVTIELDEISVDMKSCKRNDDKLLIKVNDLTLLDDRVLNGSKYSKIVEKKSYQEELPLINIEFINFKDNDLWESSAIIEFQPARIVLSLGLILSIKDFFLLPFVANLTIDELEEIKINGPSSIEIPSLSNVIQGLIDKLNGGKLKLELLAHSPQILLPVSNYSTKLISMDVNGVVKLTNSYSPLKINELYEFDVESMFINLDQLSFAIYDIGNGNGYNDIKLVSKLSKESFDIKVDYLSWDSIYTNTIEMLTCGKQPTVVDVFINKPFSLLVNEEQYQFFCDMVSHLLRSLDDVPKLKLKKLNPFMLNLLLDQLSSSSESREQIKILDIFGMKVNCIFSKIDIELLSNDGNSIEFARLILEMVNLSIDMATENRPKKMLIEGTVDQLLVYDKRNNNNKLLLERYSNDKPMMEFTQLMYQSNSPYFPASQLYSSLLNFNLNNLKTIALPSFSLRVWDWVILTITSVFSSYKIDKYNSSAATAASVVVSKEPEEESINRMKMIVNIPNPLIIIPDELSNSSSNSGVSIEVKLKDIIISNEFILKANGEYQDVMNINLNELMMNLLTHNGITESTILNNGNLVISMENYIQDNIDLYDQTIEQTPTSKFTIKSSSKLSFKFNQIQYNHFYKCINSALKRHYEMDSISNSIYLKPNNINKQTDMITIIQLNYLQLLLLSDDDDDIDDDDEVEIQIHDLSLENIINSRDESMQVVGLIGNLKVIDSVNQIVIIEPIHLESDRFFTMFKYKTYSKSLKQQKQRQLSQLSLEDPSLIWDTEFEFNMKSVQFNLSLPNINIPLSIQPFLLSILEKYPIETRPTTTPTTTTTITTTANQKMKIDINLLYSKIFISPTKTLPSNINDNFTSSSTNLSGYDYMVISFNDISMKHQPNQINKIDDVGTLLMDIESVNYKVSSLSVEIILSNKKPYFLLSDIDINANQRTIRNHLEIINQIHEWEDHHDSSSTEISDIYKDQLLISKTKTSIHSNASQIDLHSNHFEFLWNLYQSIGKINNNNATQDDEGERKKDDGNEVVNIAHKEYLSNFIEFQLKDIKINLINQFNNSILNISLSHLETYLRQTLNDNIIKLDGSIHSLIITDSRRESRLLSKYQNLISNYSSDGNSSGHNNNNHLHHHGNTKSNILKFSFKPWVYIKENEENEQESLLFSNNNNIKNTEQEFKDKWDQHLILSISNSQITPIFDLFTEIQDNFLPSNLYKQQQQQQEKQDETVVAKPSRIKIDLTMECNQFILPMNFEISNYYLRNEIKKLTISNDYKIESSYESNLMFLEIQGFSIDSIMSVLIDSNQPRVNRIMRDSNINISTKIIDWPKSSKPQLIPSLDTEIDVESIDFIFCIEEYKFMYDTLNSTLKRYYDFKYLPLEPLLSTITPSFEELTSIENKVKCKIQSLTMNMIKRQKPNTKDTVINSNCKAIGQIVIKKLSMNMFSCKQQMKLTGSINSMYIRSIKTKDNNHSLYLDIMKPKYNFDNDNDDDEEVDSMIKFEYISHSEAVSIKGDKSTIRTLWDSQYSVDISSINLVSKIATLLKIKDFIMEPLQQPFVQPPSNKPSIRDSIIDYKPKMYQIVNMKPWTLEIPLSETSTEMISIEFGSISISNFYRLYFNNGITLNKQIEVLAIDITQFTMYTQRDILSTMVSNPASLQMEVEKLFTMNDKSLPDIKTIAKIPNSFELIFSADDYLFIYSIFTGNWMFNDLDELELSKAPNPPSTPSLNNAGRFQYIPLDHSEQIKISENQFSSPKGFINLVEDRILQSFILKIDQFNFHMNPILDPLAILAMNNVILDYHLYRDGIQKTKITLKDVLLLDERKNTDCVFKEILTRKQQSNTNNNMGFNSNNQSPQQPHIIIDYLMDPNHNRQFTSIQLDHPMLFVSPNSILPILDFFTSLQQQKERELQLLEKEQQPINSGILDGDLGGIDSGNNKKKLKLPAHIRFYLKVTKPKLLLVEDETQQNTNALVMKMPIEFHFSKTSDLNQTMELHASKCQLFRTTPFSDSNNGATSTPITNSFAFTCIFIQFNENDQQTIEVRFQPLNICLSYKEILMINRLINNLSLSNYKEQLVLKQQQEQEAILKEKREREFEKRNKDKDIILDNSTASFDEYEDGDDTNTTTTTTHDQSTSLNEEDENEIRIQKSYRELEKKKKERKELSKSKTLIAPGRPDESMNLMHKTRLHVEFLGRVSFTLLDESVTMKDIPFVQLNIGEFNSDYWSWEEYSFLSCDMYLKVEVFNQKHMAFDSLVEQFQLNLQVLQSDDPKLKISLKSNSPCNINISQPFIQALANFYQNILKTNNLINNNNNNNNNINNNINNNNDNTSLNNSLSTSFNGNNSISSNDLITFENVNPEEILFATTTTTTSNSTSFQTVSPTLLSHNNSFNNIRKQPTTTISHQRNSSNNNSGIETAFNLSTSPGWKKPINAGYIQQVDYYSSRVNSLTNNIINSKTRDMRSSVDLSLLTRSGQTHQRSNHQRNHSRTNSSLNNSFNNNYINYSSPLPSSPTIAPITSSINPQTLFTTEGNNQFWIVNLTGKSIEYYVEELNFVQSYNVNDSGSGLNTNNVINLSNSYNSSTSPSNSYNNLMMSGSYGGISGGHRRINSNGSNGSNSSNNLLPIDNYNNTDDEEEKKITKKSLSSVLSQKEVHVLKNKEKQALELNSVLFKTRDFRAHGSLNAHVAIRFIDQEGSGGSNSNDNNSIGTSSQWIHGVSINQVGDNFYFPPFGNKANLVVCEVGWDEKNESKIATLRSPVLIKNSTNTPIDILLISNSQAIENQLFGPIRVDENFYIPVDFWNYNSAISIRPHGKDLSFDQIHTLNLCESSSWPESHIFNSFKEIVNHSISSSSGSSQSYANSGHYSSSNSKIENVYLGTMIQSGIRCDRTGLISTTLIVTPPIIFENVLLCDIEIRIVSHSSKKRANGDSFLKNLISSGKQTVTTLQPGKQMPWYHNHGADVGITLSLKGLGKDQYFQLPNQNHNSPLATTKDKDKTKDSGGSVGNGGSIGNLKDDINSIIGETSTGLVSFTQEIPFLCTPEYTNNSYTLLLKIDHRFEGGCHLASIYCTNAIQNHTMIPFLLRPSNMKLANALTLETNEDPLMLSHDKFYCYHPSSPKIPSKEFDIILGKEDIIEIQFEGAKDQMRFQFKAIVSTGYNVFFRTRIVDIYPRFVLVNKLPVSLSYTQVNKDIFTMVKDSQLLSPDSSIPFHWFNGKEEQQLSISIGQGTGDQSWTWSGGMRIDQVGINFLKLRHQYDDLIEQSIKVEVRDTSESTMIYFYSNDPQNLPFHIKNETFTIISFSQKHPGSKKYTLKPLESLYFTWDFPSGERKLSVQITTNDNGTSITTQSQDINLNKIKVFKPIKLPNNNLLIFPIVESSNGTTRNLLFTTSHKETKELDLLEFAFDVSFSNLAFSFIDDVPQELIYVAFKDFNFWSSVSNLTETTWLIIDDIQIDNQQPDTEYPVLLWCDKKRDSQALPFLEYSAVKLKKKNIKYYDLIALYLNEMYVQLDDKTLLNLNSFYQKIPMYKFFNDTSTTNNNSNNDNNNDPTSQQSPSSPRQVPPQSSEEPSTSGAVPENFYIKWLIFAEIKIYLTFSISRDGILSNYNKMPTLRLIIPSLGKSLGQLENAPLNINQLGVKNIFTTMSNLTELLSSHYTKQMKRQIHVILGSSNIFGSPLVFFNNISTGMTEAIEDPIMGSIQLMKRILYAAANSSSKLFGTISSGFATWSLDETYLRKRDAEEKVKAKHIAHGFYLGSKGFAMGIIDGVFGIVEHPVRGAMQEGVFGFFKGCGKGILGIAVKPVTGVFDFASKTSEGIRNNTNIHPERFRLRTPRFINPREPIKEYSIDESEGNFLLLKNEQDITKNEGNSLSAKMEYKFHVVLPDCTLLLTSNSLICLSKKGIYRWSFPLSEISKLVNIVAKCKLNIHLKNYRSFGTFSQLRKKISIHCPSDSVLFQLYSKITSCFNKSNRLELEENSMIVDELGDNSIAMISTNKSIN